MDTNPVARLCAKRAAAVLVAVVVSSARAAFAFIDASGAWDVTWDPPGPSVGQRICILSQAAPNLTIDCEEFAGPPALVAFKVTATIDANTGVFSWTGTSNPEFGCPDPTIDGTVDAGATSFTGSAHFFSFQPGFGCIHYSYDLSAVRSACGNGVTDVGEDCDDGNNLDGDCTCERFCDDPEGAACDDGVFCNGADHCSGGTCAIHPGDPCNPNAGPCADHCDEDANNCFEPAGTRQCGVCEACNGAGVCVPTPLPPTSCKQSTNPIRSSLSLKQAGVGKDKLRWKWRVGQATDPAELGDPTTVDDYTLCVFGADGALPVDVLSATAHHSPVTCATCWKRLGNPPGTKGVKYKAGGEIQSLLFKPGAYGKASISVGAGGPSLHLPSGAIPLPVRVQLLVSNGGCWEGTFSSPSVNDGTHFKAKGD